MEYRKILLSIALSTGIITSSQAGVFGTTSHSRANCATFNESVTWNKNESHWWRVKSLHQSERGEAHLVDTGMAYTWRAAAFHAGEALGERTGQWYVQGYHFYLNNGREIYDSYTSADGCNQYDGWWG